MPGGALYGIPKDTTTGTAIVFRTVIITVQLYRAPRSWLYRVMQVLVT
jgi:hypothetical protein